YCHQGHTNGKTTWQLFEMAENGRGSRAILPVQLNYMASHVVLGKGLYAWLMEDPETERAQIYFSANGAAPQLVTRDINDYTFLHADAEGRRLLTTNWKSEGSIWILDLTNPLAGNSPRPATRKLPLELRDALPAVWTPGGSLLYTSSVAGISELWTTG